MPTKQKELHDVIDAATFVGSIWEWEYRDGWTAFVEMGGYHFRGDRIGGYSVEFEDVSVSWILVDRDLMDVLSRDAKRMRGLSPEKIQERINHVREFLPHFEWNLKMDEEDFVQLVEEGKLRQIKPGPQRLL